MMAVVFFNLFHSLLCPQCLEQGLAPIGYSIPIEEIENRDRLTGILKDRLVADFT